MCELPAALPWHAARGIGRCARVHALDRLPEPLLVFDRYGWFFGIQNNVTQYAAYHCLRPDAPSACSLINPRYPYLGVVRTGNASTYYQVGRLRGNAVVQR